MSNNNAASSRVLLRVFFAALLAFSGLASCGDVGDSTNTIKYIITASADPGGTVTPSDKTTVTEGASKTYTITPNVGYIIATVVVDGNPVAATTSYTFTNVQAAHTISATFSAVPTYTITASAGPGGTITPSGATLVTQGTSQAYTITPNPGYIIASLVVDGVTVATSNTYTFTNVQANHTISATFSVALTFTITASAGPGGTVTPSGATLVTQGTSQAYTITPNPGYIIATLVVDNVSVATSNTYTFTNVQAGHTISATFSVAPAGNIVLSLMPARTSGVAPLAVFFDASATTDTGVTTRPFHDLEYTWSFGDPGAGIWSNGTQPGVSSKNSSTGPVASHVFETQGIYSVTLTVFDGANSATTNATITVDDPDVVFAGTNTICVAQLTTPVAGANGCPAGALPVMQPSFATAVNTYANTGRRVLFKRGDSFAASSQVSITSNGPGTIGAYGSITDPKPFVQTPSGDILLLSNQSTPGISDWRVMDIYFDGNNGAGGTAIRADGGINQVLILRSEAHNFTQGFSLSYFIPDWHNTHGYPGHTIFDQIAIVESTVQGIRNGGMGSFISAQRFSFLGNMYDDAATSGQHVVRLPYVGKGVFSNNTLSRSGSQQHVLKLHAPMQGEIGVTNPAGVSYTEKVVISDNKFINGANNPWTISIEPQNPSRDERLRDIIIERNWFYSGTSSQQVALLVSAVDSTVRNNVCDLTGAASHEFFRVFQRGVEPAPNNVQVYNNTIYSGSAGDFYGVNIGSTATNVTVTNNLGSAPSATGPIMIFGTGASGLVQSNNLLSASPASTLFVSSAPIAPADFSLKPLPNPARDAGLSTIPVFSDFFRTSRPQNGVIDISAIEGP